MLVAAPSIVSKCIEYTARFAIDRLPNFRRLLSFQHRLVRRLDSAGARVLVGTDAFNNFVLPGFSVHDELQQLVLAGLRPAAALRAATSNVAEFMGQAGLWGVVARVPGRTCSSSTVIPLQDINNTRLIAGVMRAGVWYPRDQLRGWLERLGEAFAIEERLLGSTARGRPRASVILPRSGAGSARRRWASLS